jgi:ribosome-interacting GTPase 1
MPANLPPAYHSAEQRFREARTPDEKIAALEEMLAIMPKHKGTDRLQGDIKARIAKLRKQEGKKGARKGLGFMVRREGAGQVALVGPANTGKSSIVARLTKARPEVASYPYTTREPVPGMMPFENIAIQLVDLPPLSEVHLDPWLLDTVRAADLFWIVVGPEDPLGQMESARGLLRVGRIEVRPPGEPEPEAVEFGWRWRKAVVVVTGLDRPGARDNAAALDELLEGRWPIVPVSSATGEGLEDLRRRTFEALEIVRVYTKQPGKPPDLDEPFTLPRGSTVGQLAERIHKDILAHMKFARIWGKRVFEGQTVQREHVLDEGDVVEIHA